MSATGVVLGLGVSVVARPGFNLGLAGPEPGLFQPFLIAVALLLTTMLAAALPARRAASLDPNHALRQE